jgi:maleate isomerase
MINESAALLQRCAPSTDARTIKKAGHITPSTNTTVEPLTTLLSLLDGGAVSQHFSRLSVQRLALDGEAEAQFETKRMLAAAQLLAEAPLGAIAWNGTSGGWLGRDHDVAIVDAIEAATKIRATTTTLAMYEIYRRFGWTRIGIACPYTDDVTAAIVEEYERQGFTIAATANLGLESNLDMGNAQAADIWNQLGAVATTGPDCIAVICTNLSAVQMTPAFEAQFGIPIVDSVAATFVEVSRLCGRDVQIEGLGRLLSGRVEAISHA